MLCMRCGFTNAVGGWQCAQCGSPLQPAGASAWQPPPARSSFPVGLVIGLAVALPLGVCVLGMMAAIAIPAFTRYVKRSKTSEATANLSRIYQAEISYFNRTAEQGTGRFVSAGVTPAGGPTAMRFPANPAAWTSDPGWAALGFSLTLPHYYQYQVTTPAPGTFTVTAFGDIDGDGIQSTFSRTASVQGGEIVGGPIEITNELE